VARADVTGNGDLASIRGGCNGRTTPALSNHDGQTVTPDCRPPMVAQGQSADRR
jgi:hypothetical protein